MNNLKFRAWDKKARDIFETTLEIYRHKPKGLLTNTYHKMKNRNLNNGYGKLPFSLQEFINWSIEDLSFLIAFNGWVESGYNKKFKPSPDRIDSNKGYSFKNINWTFWKDNYYKGIKETALKRQKPIVMYKDGKLIGRFKSVEDARYFLNINSNGNISENIKGNRKTVHGYKFIYENKELLENEI